MTLTRYAFSSLVVALMATAPLAQTVAEPPRFNGSRNTASSTQANVTSDPQHTENTQVQIPPNALVGAAVLEAAREEGRHFVQDRKSRPARRR